MPTDNGYSNQKKKGTAQFETVHNLNSESYGKKAATVGVYEKTASAAISSITDILGSNGQVEYWNIQLTSHGALVKDLMRITSSSLENFEYEIMRVIDANNFYVLPISDTKPTGLNAEILGWVTQKLASDGSNTSSVTVPPIEFKYNGVDTNVSMDTVTPANSRPLPTISLDATGNVANPLTNTELRASAVPVSAASLPLPTGASTQLGQDTGNTSLGEISTHTFNIPNVISTEGGAQPSHGLVVAGHTGAGTVKHMLVDSNGVQSVNVNNSALPTGAATAANQATEITSLSTIATNTTNINNTIVARDAAMPTHVIAVGGKTSTNLLKILECETNGILKVSVIANPSGAATSANQVAEQVLIGAVTETAPATDTASSGLNGRLQRIAQRLTSLIALIPASLGQKASAASFATVLSTEQEAILTAIQTGTAARTINSMGQSATTTSATLTAPANTKGFTIQNSTRAEGALRFTKTAGGASATVGFLLEPGQSTSYQEGASSLDVFAVDGTAIDACVVWYV